MARRGSGADGAGLTGPYRALYRTARQAQTRSGNATTQENPDAERSGDPAHAAMRRQVEDLLKDNAVDPDRRRRILDSLLCPCCGGTGASFAMSIKPAAKAGF